MGISGTRAALAWNGSSMFRRLPAEVMTARSQAIRIAEAVAPPPALAAALTCRLYVMMLPGSDRPGAGCLLFACEGEELRSGIHSADSKGPVENGPLPLPPAALGSSPQ